MLYAIAVSRPKLGFQFAVFIFFLPAMAAILVLPMSANNNGVGVLPLRYRLMCFVRARHSCMFACCVFSFYYLLNSSAKGKCELAMVNGRYFTNDH
jgi:hypothetical protein